ncbi:MAG: ssDNA-binding domain-containing protein [Lachnospiraceae bacterium]|nr:ssDNA-binding domain-containing protein [Lachnospiraceae bacterium]
MSRPQNAKEFREELAKNFSHILEEKGLSWKKEWHCGGNSAPYNAITKTPYHGCNSFALSMVAFTRGYNDPRWMTMTQIMDKEHKYHSKEHWHLKKGSTATYVEYWYPFDLKAKKALTWDEYTNEINSGRETTEFLMKTRYTAVFNACDVEGISPLQEYVNEDVDIDVLVSTLSKVMGVEIKNDGKDRAFYQPKSDMIHLPKPTAFESTYAYNSTALHELAHSTAHPSRLNRPIGGKFGSEEYAFEELIAEMSSCFMSVHLNAEISDFHLANHKAYVQSWISAIKEKPEALAKAISEAQKVAEYIDLKAGYLVQQKAS